MKKFMISSTASDSHMWNLVFLQLLLEEHEQQVVNLGHCVPIDLLIKECHQHKPDYLLISSVNGHGFKEGLQIIEEIKRYDLLHKMKLIIGGKLNTRNTDETIMKKALIEAGFDYVFIGEDAIENMQKLLQGLDTEIKAA